MSKMNLVVPRVTSSPGESRDSIDAPVVDLDPVGRAEVDDLPVAGRSATKLGVLAGDVRVGEHAVALARAAEDRHRAVEHVAAIVHGDDRLGADQSALGAAALPAGLLRGHRVDHRVALLALRGRLALPGRRLDEPGLDPELAEPKALVGLEVDLRAGSAARSRGGGRARAGSRTAPARASAHSPRAAGGPRPRARPCTGSGRRRARPRPCGGRPSPWPACGRSRPAGPATRRHG